MLATLRKQELEKAHQTLLAEHLTGRRDTEREDVGPDFSRLLQAYPFLMLRLFKSPILVAVGVVPLMAGGYFAY